MPDPNADNQPSSKRGILAELVSSEASLATLVANLGQYRRQFVAMLRAPVGCWPSLPAGLELNHGVAFMLQGIVVAIIVLTLGVTLPQWVATSAATHPLTIGDRAQLLGYAGRVEQVNAALPADLAKLWREQGELMLLIRLLPEERFTRLLARVRELAQRDPELLRGAIDGSVASSERFGGRGYLLGFLLALDPNRGRLLWTTHQLVSAGPRYQLQDHMAFLVRSLALWCAASYAAWRLLPRPHSDARRRTVFTVSAYLIGFVAPLAETLRTLLRVYLGASLPAYIAYASPVIDGANPGLDSVSGGIFAYENLALAAVQVLGFGVIAALAMWSFATGVQRWCGVRKPQAWRAAIALPLGYAAADGLARLVTFVLAPTGLVALR